MLIFLKIVLSVIFRNQSTIIAENIALKHQISVLKRAIKRPKIRKRDRIFWVLFSKLWNGWRNSLFIIKPETVVKWHKLGFNLYWRLKSRRKPGRPTIDYKIISLIHRMSCENSTWGTPHIRSELLLLGYDVAEPTIDKYMVKERKPSSQTWRTFLKNHMHNTVAIDFFTIPTATFQIFYVFLVLRHSDRKLLHFNVTKNPTAQWTANQIVDAFPYDTAPKYLVRDRDSIYGKYFQNRVRSMNIEEVKISFKSPWQSPYCERIIGSIRRECLDHMIIVNEKHLRSILKEYSEYYNEIRPHLSLNRNSPIPRTVKTIDDGDVVATPVLGGLHHCYSRAA